MRLADCGRNFGTRNALGQQTRNIFDAQGRVTTHIDAMGITNRYVYDNNHNLLSNTEAAGTAQERTTRYEYDSRHRPVAVSNALGHVTHYSYNEANQILSVSNAASLISYSYYTNGLLWTQTDGRSNTTEFIYDAYGNVRLMNLPDGSTVSNQWNVRGDLLMTRDALGNSISNSYDNNRRLISTTDPRGNTAYKTWYNNGLAKADVDAGGRTNQYAYTPAYNLSTVVEPDGSVVSNSYDNADRLISVGTPEGRTTHFSVDAIGQSTNIQYPSTAFSRSFNARGSVIETKNAKNEITQYNRDVLDRVTNVVHNGQWKASFAYDFLGNIISGNGQHSTVSFSYDSMNRLSNSVLQVSSQYDLNGNRTGIIYPGGFSVPYQYDENNRLASVSLSAFGLSSVDFSYDAAGRMTNIAYPNNVSGSFSHNQNGQIIEYSYQSGTNKFLHRILQRNALGFKTVEDVCAGPSPQLSGQIHKTRVNNSADQLVLLQSSAGTTDFTYDANGCLINQQSEISNLQFHWDFDNKLTSVSSVSSVVHYLYDASGARISRISNGVTNYFVIDYKAPLKMPLAEVNAAGHVTRFYIWSTHGLLAHLDVTDNGSQITVDSVSCYHMDETGSTLALTDGTGSVTDQYNYSPNGTVLLHSGTNSTPYQWLGALAVRNEENGLYYMLNRYYSSEMKQFISIDPKGIEGGYNLYAYANLNPLFFSDPFGLEAGYHAQPGSYWNDIVKLFKVENFRMQGYGEATAGVGGILSFFKAMGGFFGGGADPTYGLNINAGFQAGLHSSNTSGYEQTVNVWNLSITRDVMTGNITGIDYTVWTPHPYPGFSVTKPGL